MDIILLSIFGAGSVGALTLLFFYDNKDESYAKETYSNMPPNDSINSGSLYSYIKKKIFPEDGMNGGRKTRRNKILNTRTKRNNKH